MATGSRCCANCATARNSTPVLVLTARGGLQDRVSGLRSGADDYMVKPFALEELVAGWKRSCAGRVRAIHVYVTLLVQIWCSFRTMLTGFSCYTGHRRRHRLIQPPVTSPDDLAGAIEQAYVIYSVVAICRATSSGT